MADNYTHFSVLLELTDEAQRDWVARYLPLISEDYGERGQSDRLAELESHVSKSLFAEFGEAIRMGYPTMAVGFVDDGLWVQSGEMGDVYLTTLFLAIVMAKFGIEERVVLLWADTCSKPRLGGFSGGAAVVNCHGYSICGPLDQIHACHKLLDDLDKKS